MTRNEEFQRDFNNRFSRHMMVSDESFNRIHGFNSENICCRKQIKEWIRNWTIVNTPSEERFMQNVDDFIEAQFSWSRQNEI